MDGGSVTMDGSTIANCIGTASSYVHSFRVVGPLGRCLVCWWVWWVGRCFWVGVKEEVSVCVCVCVRHGSRWYGFAYVSADRERC